MTASTAHRARLTGDHGRPRGCCDGRSSEDSALDVARGSTLNSDDESWKGAVMSEPVRKLIDGELREARGHPTGNGAGKDTDNTAARRADVTNNFAKHGRVPQVTMRGRSKAEPSSGTPQVSRRTPVRAPCRTCPERSPATTGRLPTPSTPGRGTAPARRRPAPLWAAATLHLGGPFRNALHAKAAPCIRDAAWSRGD